MPWRGIAVTGLTSTYGTWEYNVGGGWVPVGAVSDANALLLRDTDSLRFVPDAQNGEPVDPTLTWKAWDQSDGNTPGHQGRRLDDRRHHRLLQQHRHRLGERLRRERRPDAGARRPHLPGHHRGRHGQPGRHRGQPPRRLGGRRGPGAVEGIAVNGLTTTYGTWEYNVGGGWVPVGAVSDANALLLRDPDSLRFVPDAQNGEPVDPTVTYKAWDRSDGGTQGTKVDASVTGGTTAFSNNTDTASIVVSDVNDAPTLTPIAPTFAALTEDDTANPAAR